MSMATFTENTPPPGSAGGVLNALYGSVVMTFLGVRDRCAHRRSRLGRTSPVWAGFEAPGTVVRFVNDVLLSTPSIMWVVHL